MDIRFSIGNIVKRATLCSKAKRRSIRYERVSWLPVLLVFLVALGIGGKNLSSSPTSEPTTAAAVLSFTSVIAGFVLTYSPLASDYTTYMDTCVNR